jgi:hypothetical protein
MVHGASIIWAVSFACVFKDGQVETAQKVIRYR